MQYLLVVQCTVFTDTQLINTDVHTMPDCPSKHVSQFSFAYHTYRSSVSLSIFIEMQADHQIDIQNVPLQ